MPVAKDLKAALTEFQALSEKEAPVLAKKGKPGTVKAISATLKKRKTVEEVATAFDNMIIACDKAAPPTALAELKKLQVIRKKLSDQLKAYSAEFATQAKDAGPADPKLKSGFEILAKRLTQLSLHAKMTAEQKEVSLKALVGNPLGNDEKLKKDIRQVYLGIRKGADETEALMKKFLAKPTKENMLAAFSSATGPRSISDAVTSWKETVKKLPPPFDAKTKFGDADPEKLLTKIVDLTQNKGAAFWDAKLKTDKPDWEAGAKAIANDCLKNVEQWRISATKMKELVEPKK
jgi:hypothetical protein